MKTRQKKVNRSRRSATVKRVTRLARERREPTLLEKIEQLTEELQALRSRLANAGDNLPPIGTHRIASLETELERLWEMRRMEQAAPLRQTALSEEEEKVLAYPTTGRTRS